MKGTICFDSATLKTSWRRTRTDFYDETAPPAEGGVIPLKPLRGEGRLETTALPGGLTLLWADQRLRQPVEFRVAQAQPQPMLCLGAVLAGGFEASVGTPERFFAVEERTWFMGHFSAGPACKRYPAGRRIVEAGLNLPGEYLAARIYPLLGGEQRELTRWLEGGEHAGGWKLHAFTAETARILHGLSVCPYAGAARVLWLEARVLDWLAACLAHLAPGFAPEAPLTRNRRDQIHAAAHLLAANLEAPPCLHELARLTGLNEFSLKQGFRQVFAQTAFGHLRSLRMARARQLLQGGSLTVSHAASLVGYANASHFAAAFKREFGVNPATVARRPGRA